MDSEILAAYAFAEYLLVLEPHESLADEIQQIKKMIQKNYGCLVSLKETPHISLVRFQQYEMMEQRIKRRLEGMVNAESPFLVELDGFGGLPTHSVFIRVSTQKGILTLQQKIKSFQQLLKADKERKPHFILQPYMAIASHMSNEQFEQCFTFVSNTHFSGRFMADQLILLRKREGEKRFTELMRCPMKHTLSTCSQPELFT